MKINDALEEAVCEAMTGMLTHTNALQYITELKEYDEGIYSRLEKIILNLQKIIHDVYDSSYFSLPDEGKEVLQMGKDEIDKLAKLFAEGVSNMGSKLTAGGEKAKATTKKSADFYETLFTRIDDVNCEYRTDKFGNKYWHIETQDDIFKGIESVSEIQSKAYEYILEHRDKKTVFHAIGGKKMQFIRLSAEEFTNSIDSKTLKNDDPETYKRKMRMLPSLENILTASTVNWHAPDLKNHSMFKEKGFENYRGKVGIDNVIFNTIVIAGKAKFGDIFYDIKLEVDQILPHDIAASGIKKSTSNTNKIIPIKQGSQDNSQDSHQYKNVNEEYMELAKNPEKNEARLREIVDAAAKKAGYTGKGYHGTYDFGKTKFDKYDVLFLTDSVSVARQFSGGQPTRTVNGGFNPEKASDKSLIEYAENNTYADGIRLATAEDFERDLDIWGLSVEELRPYYGDEAEQEYKRNQNHLAQTQADYDAFKSGKTFFAMDFNSIGRNSWFDRETLENFVKTYTKKYASTKEGGGVYDLYYKKNGILSLDCEGNYYTDVPLPTALHKYARHEEIKRGYVTTDQMVRIAFDAGFNGVEYKNMVEGGDYGNAGLSNVYAIFNPTQNVKSADLVTYDDDGNIIPLEKRFNAKEDDIRYQYRGKNVDDIEVYETSADTLKLTKAERAKKFASMLSHDYKGRTARFMRNGHVYYAEFDRIKPAKSVYGDYRSTSKGKRAYINAGADGDVFDLVENATYDYSSRDKKNHKAVDNFTDYFDYYVKTVQIDGTVYDLNATVKKKYGERDGYTYTLVLRENKKIKASPARNTQGALKVEGDASLLENNTSSTDSQDNSQDSHQYRNEEALEPISEDMYTEMKNHFGTTNDIRVAGYLLKDGKLLDFSGKHWGDTYSKTRTVDHRDINEVVPDGSVNYGAMQRMIADGNIRLMPEVGGICLSTQPTTKQRQMLSYYIKMFSQYYKDSEGIIVDFNEPGGDTVYSKTYRKGVDTRTVLRDIDNYFKYGTRTSTVAEFHESYQHRNTDMDERYNYENRQKLTEIDPRRALINAMRTVAQDGSERKIIQQYEDDLYQADKLQDRVYGLKQKIHDIEYSVEDNDFAKEYIRRTNLTNAEKSEIVKLKGELQKAQNQLSVYDSRMLRLWAQTPMKNLVENAKKTEFQRGRYIKYSLFIEIKKEYGINYI